MCISQICDFGRNRIVDWLTGSHMTTTTAVKLKSAFCFIFLKRLAGSLLLKQNDIKYKLSMFWAVFRGRSRSLETLSCVTSRRSEASKRQRLNQCPAAVCGWTSDSWHIHCIVAHCMPRFIARSEKHCSDIILHVQEPDLAAFDSSWRLIGISSAVRTDIRSLARCGIVQLV